MAEETFVELAHYQLYKYNQRTGGDIFISQKNQSDGRVITTLSDGLGSGIKAGVLATLTATMATKFIAYDIPIRKAAEIIMNTLPADSEKGISYATFTLVDIEPNSTIKIVEYDNPPYILVHDNKAVTTEKEITPFERKNKKTAPKQETVLKYSSYDAKPGDRLVFFSDGVTQSGMGTPAAPFGWGSEDVEKFVLNKIAENPSVSARDLARFVVQEASAHDSFSPKDDITCGVVYFRTPRDMLVMTGPAIHKENDKEMARIFSMFKGHKIICGGTTANILSRELKLKITTNMENITEGMPPVSEMEGADMVTEGIITLAGVSEILESGAKIDGMKSNAATKIVELFLDCDRIKFVVGTKINEAHQDPSMPAELEIRRNVVKKIVALLQEKYLKEVAVQYF